MSKLPVLKGSERIAAAKAILDYALKGIELEDHEMRLQDLRVALPCERSGVPWLA